MLLNVFCLFVHIISRLSMMEECATADSESVGKLLPLYITGLKDCLKKKTSLSILARLGLINFVHFCF